MNEDTERFQALAQRLGWTICAATPGVSVTFTAPNEIFFLPWLIAEQLDDVMRRLGEIEAAIP